MRDKSLQKCEHACYKKKKAFISGETIWHKLVFKMNYLWNVLLQLEVQCLNTKNVVRNRHMFIFLQSEYKGSGFLLIYRILHSGQACLVIKFSNLMRLTGEIAAFLGVLGENRGSCASSSMVCVTLAWSGNSIMFSGNSLPRRHETARVSPCVFQIQLVNHSEQTTG